MPAVEYATSGTLSDSRPFTVGYTFSLSAPVTINALGYWDNGRGSSHQVGIWDSAGTLLTSTTVLGTDPGRLHEAEPQNRDTDERLKIAFDKN